jgi:cytochrome P450
MVVLDSCLSEALRLTSGSMIMRQVMVPDAELTLASGNTYRFRKGDKVGLFPCLQHFDPDLYPSPDTFQYDRFLNASHTAPISTVRRVSTGVEIPLNVCYLPFGAGAHYCPGRKFARNEIKTIVAFLLANYQLSFVDDAAATAGAADLDGSRAGLGVFPPKKGLDLKILPKW